MNHTFPKPLCETCSRCEGCTVTLTGFIEVTCRKDGYVFSHVLPKVQCESYLEEGNNN